VPPTAIITQAKVRSALSTLLDNFYPTVITDDQDTTTVFTKTDTDFEYEIKLSKVGRLVSLSGYIENITDISIADQPIATITNTEFVLETGITNYLIPAITLDGLIVFVSLRTNTISLAGTVPPNTKYYFNGSYNTKD